MSRKIYKATEQAKTVCAVLAGTLCALACLASAASAETITLGPALGMEAQIAAPCSVNAESNCAYANTTLGEGVIAQAPAGGTITHWSVQDFGGKARLLVLAANEAGEYSVTAESAVQSRPCSAPICGGGLNPVYTFATELPIAAGELIAVELINNPGCANIENYSCSIIGLWGGTEQEPLTGTAGNVFDPSFTAGAAQPLTDTFENDEVLVNAELQTSTTEEQTSAGQSLTTAAITQQAQPTTAGATGLSITVTGRATLSAQGSAVAVPVDCQYACDLLGELAVKMPSGKSRIYRYLEQAALAQAARELRSDATRAPRKTVLKPFNLGAGSLTVARPGAGTLLIKLNTAARRAIAKAKGQPFTGVLTVAVHTSAGAFVKTEQLTLTVWPHPQRQGTHSSH